MRQLHGSYESGQLAGQRDEPDRLGDSKRFYIDASVPIGVARALAEVRSDIAYPEQPGCPIADRSTHDEVWLPIVGANDWIAILRDSRVRTRPWELRAILEHGVRAFIMTHAGNYTRWQTLELIVRAWPGIEDEALKSGPFVCSVTKNGIHRVSPLSE